jgi:hypothetical protein
VSRSDIQKVPAGALAGVPAYLRRAEGAPAQGTENIDRQDMVLPRLGLCQSLSPQRIKSGPKYIPNLEEGQYFNTITQEIYGSHVRVVPLLFFKSRLLFGDMDAGGGLRCQAPDALTGLGTPGGNCLRCPLQLFKDNEPPECNLLYNYASLVVVNDRVNPQGLVVKSFKSTDLKTAREWNSLIRLRQTDLFAGIYEFNSIEVKKDPYRWYQTVVKNVGWVSEEVYAAANLAYQAVAELNQAGRLRHDVEDLNPAAAGRGEASQEM